MTDGFNTVNGSAAELLGAAPAPVFTAPQPAPVEYSAPAEPVQTFQPAEPEEADEPEEEAPVRAAEPEEAPENDENDNAFAEVFAQEEPAEGPAEEPVEESRSEPEESAPATFDDDWSGSEMADAIAEAEKKMAAGEKQDIPLVNPDTGSDPFGGVFNMDDSHDDMADFDMGAREEPAAVDDIKPLDVSDHSEASYDNDFTRDLLAQTMPSSALGDDADEDLLAAVKAAEEAAALKPNNVSNIDMDEEPETASSGSEEDDLMKALREAEAAFGGTSYNSADVEEPEEDASAAADPWAELQNQLKAMESANGASSAITYETPEPQEEEQPEDQSTTPPSADDSSIWDFGGGNSGNGSSDDDDMSSDFGGFGGF